MLLRCGRSTWLGAALLAACGGDRSPSAGTDTDIDTDATTGQASSTDDGVDGSEGDGGPGLPPRPAEQRCRFDGWAPGLLAPVQLAVLAQLETTQAATLAVEVDLGLAWVGTDDGRILVLPLDDPGAGPSEALVGQEGDAFTGLAVDGPGRYLFARWQDATFDTIVERFAFDDAGLVDPSSGIRVLRIPHGPDVRVGAGLSLDGGGNLVIGIGDGASGEEAGPADDRNDRLGSVLRLDVSELVSDYGAGAAADNPWIDEPGPADLTWAIGLRDPAGCAPDPETDTLWCTDVGAGASEVTFTAARDHLGWPHAEGYDCLLQNGDCTNLDLQRPDGAYRYDGPACGAVMGAVIRDGDLLDGAIVYGDRCSGEIWAADLTRDALVGRWDEPPRAFASDAEGTAWAIDAAGQLGRVEVVPAKGEFPLRLSDASCFDDLAALVHAPSVVPYELNAPLWTDAAIKRRHIALPEGTSISAAEDGSLQFPEGTVLLKTFSMQFTPGDPDSERPIETRVMVHRAFGWEFHSYAWDEAGGDATLLDERLHLTLPIEGAPLEYDLPSRAECTYCHGVSESAPLGPRLDQLARDVDYGHTVADQLDALSSVGMFDAPLPDVVAMAAPTDEVSTLEARARAYLHGNCGHCHRPGGWAPPQVTMDLRWNTPTPDAELCGVQTRYYNPWVPLDYRVVPGDPEQSAVWRRLSERGLAQMPPLATYITDPDAVAVRDWIASLSACPE